MPTVYDDNRIGGSQSKCNEAQYYSCDENKLAPIIIIILILGAQRKSRIPTDSDNNDRNHLNANKLQITYQLAE